MVDCIFCKIVEGKIPSSKIYEDDLIYSFLDINPASKGHLLIIPKRHCENLNDLTNDELKAIFDLINKISNIIETVLETSSFNLLLNYGREAGQVINHIHFHLIPRKKDDGLAISKWPFMKFSGEHLNEIAKFFREKLEAS